MTQEIKKSLQPIFKILQENAGRKVSSVLEEMMPLFLAKGKKSSESPRQVATLKAATGEVVAIKCYYFKRWMPLVGQQAVEFGTKANSATGFNSMCKVGTNQWTKQNREAKTALAALLAKVESGEIAPHEIADAKEAIEQQRKAIIPTDLGFDSLEEVEQYLASEGVSFASASDVE